MSPEAPSPGSKEHARQTPVAPDGSPASPVSTPPPPIPDHELIRLIARGSYGEVWLARAALGTLRAVKIVHRRTFWHDHPFERELHGIQKFEPISRSHEGLVDILQVGRGEGCFYYVMELADDANVEREARNAEFPEGVPGPVPRSAFPVPSSHEPVPSSYTPRTLSSELHTRGRLPVADCLSIAISLASALDHLHRHGLVHRDVKPSNVIFVGGVPKLADIGMVAEVSEARSYVGTEGFIPPEGPGTPQADLYSLGKLLYELSTGKDRHEFPALPPNLDQLPDKQQLIEVNAILLKACDPDPRRRHASAAATRAELELLQQGGSIKRRRAAQHRFALARKAATALAVLALLGAFGYLLFARFTRPTPISVATGADQASIFVLPFRHSAPIAERPIEYETEQSLCICGRMTDAFIDALPLIPGVETRPRKSDWVRYDEDQVRHELAWTNDTRYLLTGQVDHTNEVLRLTLRLYEREKDEPLWTETYARTTNDVIALEHRAIDQVARRLGRGMNDAVGLRIDQVLSNNLAAYGFFLQGRACHLTGAKIASRKALDCFDRALELDRNYVAAHVGYMQVEREYFSTRPPSEVWRRVAERARRILDIDDSCFVAQYRLANKLLACDYDWEGGIQAHDQLIARWPERNLSWMVYYRILGRTNDALVYHNRLAQEPEVDLYELQHLAFGESVWGNHDEAIRIARQSIDPAPDSRGPGQYNLGRCLLLADRYREAIDALLKALKNWEDPEMYGLLGRAHALMGDRANALELLRRLEERERADEADPYFLAWIHAALGSPDQALEYLNKAIDYRSEYVISSDFGGLRADPAWDGLRLRDDPRFEALCRRVGMGQGQWPR
jgi:tetratricopeptide (TPR) repeat protein